MNPGLLYLLARVPLSKLRQMKRRAKGLKGALVFGIALLMFGLMILPQFLASRQLDPARMQRTSDIIRLWGPPALLLFSLLFGVAPARIVFKPAETALLFPAPVSRRELLLYHVAGRFLTIVLTALWLSIFLRRFAPSYFGALAAAFLYFAFLELLGNIAGLSLAAFGERVSARFRKGVVLAVVLLIVGGVIWVQSRLPAQVDPVAAARTLAQTPAVRLASGIMLPFVEIFMATTPAAFVQWSLVSLGMLAASLIVVLSLDVAYTEAALVQSRRAQERLQRLASGGRWSSTGKEANSSLRPFPFWGGAGPLAWRQCLVIVRQSKGILLKSLCALPLPIILAYTRRGMRGQSETAGLLTSAASTAFVGFMLIHQFNSDFRQDLDRMPYLKSLPIRAWAMTLGQILPNVLLLTIVQAVVLACMQLYFGTSIPLMCLLLFAVLLPYDTVLAAVDNAIFLFMPYRIMPKEAGQPQFMGRTMAVMFIKIMISYVLIGLAAGAGALAWFCVEKSLPVALLAAGFFLFAATIPLLQLAALGFSKFDITKDIPA